jgi:hypothetical protein
MNTEEVRNHDRRFSGDPPRTLTCLAGCHEESGENTRDTRIGGSTYSSLMGWVIDSAGVRRDRPYSIRYECPMEAPTGGSGRRRHRGPVGELNLHGTCAPPVMHQLYGTLCSTSGQSSKTVHMGSY